MKYIQETDWWKESHKEAAKAFSRECQQAVDNVILEAFGVQEKACLKKTRGGVGEATPSKCY